MDDPAVLVHDDHRVDVGLVIGFGPQDAAHLTDGLFGPDQHQVRRHQTTRGALAVQEQRAQRDRGFFGHRREKLRGLGRLEIAQRVRGFVRLHAREQCRGAFGLGLA